MITQIIYTGIREPKDSIVRMKLESDIDAFPNLEQLANLPLYLEEVNHSPTGFEWGYYGSGPSQLAYAILRSYFQIIAGLSPEYAKIFAKEHYMAFKQDFVAKWQKDTWVLYSDQITNWFRDRNAKQEAEFIKRFNSF